MSEKIYEDLHLIHRRAKRALVLVQMLLVFLILVFWKIQILDHRRYWEQSEANRINEITLQPQRGLIYDRKGNILSQNEASFYAAVIRENTADLEESYRKISPLLGLEIEVLKERVRKYSSLAGFRPIMIKENLSLQEVTMIESRKREMPELIIRIEPKRYYPHSTLAAHVLGYLQEISPYDLSTGNYPERQVGDLIGVSGIEKQYEFKLAGRVGKAWEIVDSLGRKIEDRSRLDPVKGEDIHLALDLGIQKKAEELLRGREGAIVIMEAKTGAVLAMASFPTYDPNKFINRFTPQEWVDLASDQDFPLENRAIRGLYSPGSIFKLVMALGALNSGTVRNSTRYFCSGSIEIYGHPFGCGYAAGHGYVDILSGIQHSCNIYFYQVGKLMGINSIADYARLFGLGRKTGIDLVGEKMGLVPDPDWKMRTRQQPWYPGETISVAIGQGPLMVTPLQVACLTAIIANKGKPVQPYLVADAMTLRDLPPLAVDRNYFDAIIQGMWLSVNREGTGGRAKVEGFDVCGKTGSTQVVGRETAERLEKMGRIIKTHSWFSGFAPRNRPEIVVTVIVERGGTGGTTAAPIAGELFRFYRDYKKND